MRSSALLGALVATIACSLLVQGLPLACTCGNLGSGTNPCTCSETVVKAAKLPKPTFYATPEEINDAAAARSSIVIPGSSSPSVFSNLPSTGNTNPVTYSNTANANVQANTYINGNTDTVAYSSDSSNLYSNDDSNAYNDGSSVAYSTGNTNPVTYTNTANANVQANTYINGNTDTVAYSSGSSNLYSNGDSNAYNGGSSVAYSTGNTNPVTYSNTANAIVQAGTYINGNTDTIAYSGGNSNLYSNDDSNAYGSSVAYSNGGAIAYSSSNSDAYSNNNGNGNSDTITITSNNPPVNYAAVTTSDSSVNSNTGCGCSKQISTSLDLDDSTDSNVNIVPSFTPIGDLCYPLPIDSRSGKLIEKTRVTPAYPGKIVCSTCNPAAPYEICINTHSGETTSRMLSGTTIGSNSASFGTPSIGNTLPIGNTGTFGISGSGSRLGALGNVNSGAFDGSSTAYSGAYSGAFSGTSTFGGSVPGAFGATRSGLFGNVNSGAFGRFGFGKYSGSSSGAFGQSNSQVYGAPSFPFSGPSANTVQIPNGQNQFGRTVVTGSGSSNCFDDDTDEAPVDYSYPQMPADAVSLTLAYKNLRAPNVIYRQGKQFVPEDKLSFGHRTVPNDVNNEKTIADIPEERLVTVDKPVVELKVAPPRTVVIGSYDEREEAKLAELEAIERESITQEETVDRVAEGLLTYKDLGYAPVGSVYANPRSYSGIINGEINDSMEEPCGPLGPPIPDYIPGSVIVQQQLTQDNFANQFGEIGDTRPGACAN